MNQRHSIVGRFASKSPGFGSSRGSTLIARWLAVPLLAGLASVAGCHAPSATTSIAERPAVESPHALRVMAWNIRRGLGMDGVTDLERTAAVIRDVAPDVIALQEVDVGCARSGAVDQPAKLAAATGLEHHAFSSFMNHDGGRYGMAVLSRWPIESVEELSLPPGRHEPRTSLIVRVRIGDVSLDLAGVHLDWLEDDADRFRQAQALVDRVGSRDAGPTIILGDFNDQPGSRTIELARRAWREAEKPDHARLTFPADEPTQDIDAIYVHAPHGRVWLAGPARVVAEPMASDHRPVVVDVRLAR